MQKTKSNNTLSLVENITKFFGVCFTMQDVIVYATHRVVNKMSE
mgnify:CR=1 FL=1